MGKVQKISDSQKQILEILWATDNPITAKEILALLPQWQRTTVNTFLTRLRNKKIIKATAINNVHYYEPCLTEQEYQQLQAVQFLDSVYKGSAIGLIRTICDIRNVSKEEIEDLLTQME